MLDLLIGICSCWKGKNSAEIMIGIFQDQFASLFRLFLTLISFFLFSSLSTLTLNLTVWLNHFLSIIECSLLQSIL